MECDWLEAAATGESKFDRVVNHRPSYAGALRTVEAAVWRQDVMDPVILELCRLRIAGLLGCDAALRYRTPEAWGGGLDEQTASAVSHWPDDDRFDERRKVCLGYAEQLLIDAQGVDDELARQVVEVIGEGGFLVLTYACGLFETTQRARLLIGAQQW